jgi:erythromycin esterase-like protein
MQRMLVPYAREGSWEDILHRASAKDKLLLLSDGSVSASMLETRGHRAIGVVYDPAYEAFGNYVPSVLPRRYDAFLYLDETEALRPLHLAPRAEAEPPETFPSGV